MSVQEASSRPKRGRAAGSLDRSAELLKTLAHACRLRMVQMLLQGRYTVGELAAVCKIPSHQASEHLRLMQRCGLLARRVEGRKVYYEIAQPGLGPIMAFVESQVSHGKR